MQHQEPQRSAPPPQPPGAELQMGKREHAVQKKKKKIQEIVTENSQIYQKCQIKISLDLHKERL